MQENTVAEDFVAQNVADLFLLFSKEQKLMQKFQELYLLKSSLLKKYVQNVQRHLVLNQADRIEKLVQKLADTNTQFQDQKQ